MKYIFLGFFMMIAAGCATGIQFSSGSPMGLQTFPFDTATKQAVLEANGPPQSTLLMPSGNEGWVYQFGEDFGRKTYTVEFTPEGKVVDVLYNDRGPYNGTTARKLQALK